MALPAADGSGGSGTDRWARAERRLYLEMELEDMVRRLKKMSD